MLVYQRVGISRRYLGLPRFHCFGPIMADLLPEKSVNVPIIHFWKNIDAQGTPYILQTFHRISPLKQGTSSITAVQCYHLTKPHVCWLDSHYLNVEFPSVILNPSSWCLNLRFCWLNRDFWQWHPILFGWTPHSDLSAEIPEFFMLNHHESHFLLECPYLGQWNP